MYKNNPLEKRRHRIIQQEKSSVRSERFIDSQLILPDTPVLLDIATLFFIATLLPAKITHQLNTSSFTTLLCTTPVTSRQQGIVHIWSIAFFSKLKNETDPSQKTFDWIASIRHGILSTGRENTSKISKAHGSVGTTRAYRVSRLYKY